MVPSIVSLVRYPVKGMTPEKLQSADLEAGEGMPFDRIYAVENGGARFDPQNPKWLPKISFLMLMRHERFASLTSVFNDRDHTLTLLRDGKQLAKGNLKTKLGRQMIEQFLSAYMKAELNGPPRIVSADGHRFTDISAKAVHLVNLETVRNLGDAIGLELDPLRFRANIYFDGIPAWEERKWVGETVECGEVTLSIFDETGRCEATSVDPQTAARGASIPSALERIWGHNKLGVYAKVVRGGRLRLGDILKSPETAS